MIQRIWRRGRGLRIGGKKDRGHGGDIRRHWEDMGGDTGGNMGRHV